MSSPAPRRLPSLHLALALLLVATAWSGCAAPPAGSGAPASYDTGTTTTGDGGGQLDDALKTDAGGQPDGGEQADAPLTDSAALDDAGTDAGTTPDTAVIADSGTAPDTSGPDTSTPDTAAPDTSLPDTAAPDTSTPDTAAPDTSTPDAGPCGSEPTCNDNNPCTTDSCASGQCIHLIASGGCDDGNPCTVGDICASGACKSGKTKPCDDKNPCTADSCDTKTGACKAVAQAGSCDDGDPCTLNDACAAAACKSGAAKVCDDNNPCTADSCNAKTGACAATAKAGSCDDGDACTSNDSCSNGSCGGKAKVCDDKNPCTTDSCNPKTGSCATAAKSGSCDDGDVCTTSDACQSGVCKGKAKSCNDGNDCTQDLCDPKTGACSSKKLSGTPCTKNDFCTVTATCTYGTCFTDKKKDCDDNNPCTNDYCLTSSAKCAHVDSCGGVKLMKVPYSASLPGYGSCYDPYGWKLAPGYDKLGYWDTLKPYSDPQPIDGKCVVNYGIGSGRYKCGATVRTGTVTLPFFDLSTLKKGDPLQLRFLLAGNWAASDTFSLEARSGVSGSAGKWTSLQVLKAPGLVWKVITTDLSGWINKGKVQLRFVFQIAKCSGAEAYMGHGPRLDELSVSLKGTCTSKAQCIDGNTCTYDYCSTTKKTCYHTNAVNKSCSDGDACTPNDACKSGTCVAGKASACDDNDACTVDSCDSVTGLCSHKLTLSCLKTVTLPLQETFDCASSGTPSWKTAGWRMSGTPGAASWAVDSTPSYYKEPGYRSKSCSANFNDGKWYTCPSGSTIKKVGGDLTSPLLAATGAQSGEKVYAEFWLMGDIDYDDVVALETSTDGKQWSTVRTFGGYGSKLKTSAWQVYVEELPGMAGKKFLMRLRFESGDCTNNNQRGIFLDDLKIHLAKPCGQYDPYDHGYGYYSIGSVNSSHPSNTMEPPFTLSANESDSVVWYQPDSYSSYKKPRVYVKWDAGPGKVQVCASFECYKSKAYQCTTTCPSGTKKGYFSGKRIGCCTKGSVTGKGSMSFYLGGSSIQSGYGRLTVKNTGGACVQVEGSVHW